MPTNQKLFLLTFLLGPVLHTTQLQQLPKTKDYLIHSGYAEGALGEPETLNEIARPDFADDFPEVAEMMSKAKLDDDQYGSLEDLVVNEFGEGKEEAAVKKWLEQNPDWLDTIKG